VLEVEVDDAHFSNNEIFDTTTPVSFKVPAVKSNEKHQQTIFVTPKLSGDHKFEAAKYSYKINGESFKGISTNKPSQVEI
jgi:hypothetical protein